MKKIDQLIEKYDKPVPRYTSYPAVPDWQLDSFTIDAWKAVLRLAYEQYGEDGISLYVHLPYCESLCTYCGCNTRITVNHAVELPYVQAIIEEFKLINAELGHKPTIKEIHLGGGTPTFFSPEHLKLMISGLFAEATLAEEIEFSFEGHPNNTTEEHLQKLYDLGFRRVSFGIQGSDEKVQKAINRIQPDESVIKVVKWARAIGFTSVNFDLIYGLPFQTSESITKTMALVKALKPDRIAYYSYAHVPWKRPGQRAYSELDLPTPKQKHELNQLGQQLLKEMGYLAIGMDHFALAEDELFKALGKGDLHRNFMGYTTNPGKLLVGLGVSSISDVAIAYGQNAKTVEQYLEQINNGELAKFKGHMMTPEQIRVKEQILEVACQKQFSKELYDGLSIERKAQIDGLAEDGILEMNEKSFNVSEIGTQFLRNVCAVFDPNHGTHKEQKLFSKAV